MPTSMIAAPGLIQSPRTISVLPMAAIKISACRTTPAISLVREWQTVTVAFFPINNNAAGMPTIFERPKHHCVRAFNFYTGFFKEINTAIRRARHEQRLASLLSQPTNIQRGKSIHIFFDVDERKNALFIQYETAWATAPKFR